MKVGELFVMYGLDFSQYNKDEATAKSRVKSLGNTLSDTLKGAFSFTLGMGLFQGLSKGTDMLKDFIVTAMQSETYEVAMDAVARATGTSTDALKQQKKAVMDLGVAGQEATQMLTRFMQSQLDIRYATKLTRVAQDAATIAGENSSDATKQITEAIAKLRPELLSNYGMTRNLNDIYNDYAKVLGKPGSKLSEVEKKQAMLNYIFSEGEKIAGSYEAAMGTVGKQLGSMERIELPKKLLQEFKTELAGPLVMPAFTAIVEGAISSLEKAKAWVVDNRQMLQAWGESIKQTIQGVWATFSRFFSFILNNAGTIITLAGAAVKLAFAYLIATTAIKLATGAQQLFTQISMVTKGVLEDGPGLLMLLSRAVGIYRSQLSLATLAGINATGAIAKLRIALFSLKAALGPIGLISIALSLLVAAGIWVAQSWDQVKHYGLQVWGALKTGIGYAVYGIISVLKALLGWIPGIGSALAKAQNSLLSFTKREKTILASRKSAYADANKPIDEMAEAVNSLTNMANSGASALGAQADAAEGAGDAAKKAGKDARSSLSGFDEINQLLDNKANATDVDVGDVGDAGGLGDIGGMGDLGDIGDLGGLWDGALGEVDTKNKSFWPKFWDGIKKGAKFGWDAIKLVLGTAWDGICGLGKQVWSDLSTWLGNLWDGVKEKWGVFKEWLGSFWDGVKEKWGVFKEWLGSFWDGVGEKWGVFKEWLGSFWDGVGEKWGVFKEWLGSFWDGVGEKWGVFKEWLGSFWDGVGEKWGNFIDWLGALWDGAGEKASTAWGNIKTAIVTPIQAAWDWLVQTWDSITTWLSEKWNGIWTTAGRIWGDIKTAVTSPIQTAWTWLTNTWDNIASWLSQKWSDIKTNASSIFSGVKNAIIGAFDTVKTTVLNTWDTITSGLINAFNSIYSKTKDIFGRLKNFLGDTCDSIKDFFKGMANGAIRSLNGLIGGVNKLKFDVPDWVPGSMSGKHFGFNIPKISYLARGGIVDQPTLAMIGERGKEAVVPLENTSFADKLAEAVANAVLAAMQFMGGQGQNSSGSQELTIEIDGVKLARVLLPKTDAELKRRGAKSILQPV